MDYPIYITPGKISSTTVNGVDYGVDQLYISTMADQIRRLPINEELNSFTPGNPPLNQIILAGPKGDGSCLYGSTPFGGKPPCSKSPAVNGIGTFVRFNSIGGIAIYTDTLTNTDKTLFI